MDHVSPHNIQSCVVNYSLNVTQRPAHKWLQRNNGSFSVQRIKHQRRSVCKLAYCRLRLIMHRTDGLYWVVRKRIIGLTGYLDYRANGQTWVRVRGPILPVSLIVRCVI